MPDQEILDEYNQLAEGEEPQAEATPEQGQEPTQEEIEHIEYLLGEQQSKLPVNATFKVNHGGKIIEAPLSKMVNAFRLRSKLDEDMMGYKKQLSEFEETKKKYGDIEKLQSDLTPYQELQKWSEDLQKSNPIGYQRLMSTIEEIKQGRIAPSAVEGSDETINYLNQTIASLKEEIGPLKEWKTKWEQEQEEKSLNADIEAVRQEAKDFAEKYKSLGIDLDEIGESGLSLENEIIKFAAENHIDDFEAAGLKLLGPKLLDASLQRGKSDAVKGIRADKKAGIIAKSSTPFMGQNSEVDVNKLTGEQRRQMAVDEYLQALEN